MNEKRQNNFLSGKRIGYLFAMAAMFLGGTLLLAMHRKLYMDEVMCLLVLNVIFLSVFFLALLHARLTGTLLQKKDTGYKSIAAIIALAWICVILCEFCPDYFAPVMLIGIFLTAVLNDAVAMGVGIYFVFILCFTGGSGAYVLYDYILLVVIGVMLGSLLRAFAPSETLGIHIIIFLINLIVPVIFYYFAFLELTPVVFFYGIVNGLAVNLLTIALFYRTARKVVLDDRVIYGQILEDTYVLVQDIKHYSMAEYRHARRVSELAKECAREIHVNEELAACGGFYYRLGKMEGEPMIDNAVRLATAHAFPDDVIAILGEYGGILALPQTPESAIVHMVDALVTKIELLGAETMASTWNQDMVIYQTLNEISQSGLYDESGLSMNQFLRIRERLVQEESFL